MRNFWLTCGVSLVPVLCLFSCAGIKVQKGQPLQPQQSKPGISLGGPVVGRATVDRGFRCWVKDGFLTFDGVGMTEDEAVGHAAERCKQMFSKGTCQKDRCEREK